MEQDIKEVELVFECPKCVEGKCVRYKTGDEGLKKAYKCKNCGHIMMNGVAKT